MTQRPKRLAAAVTLIALVWLGALGAGAESIARPVPASKLVTIRVLSNRADLISGGEALVGVFLPAGVDPATVTVTLDGRDVTRDFEPGRLAGLMQGVPAHNLPGLDPSANALIGLVSGLTVGPNLLTAELPDGYGAHIAITNQPAGGPVFSGPQVQPWTCNAGASDKQCERKPSYQYFYIPANASVGPGAAPEQTPDPRFAPYNPASPPPPSSIAQTTTDDGQQVPFIVRVETGSVDRGQYQVAVLYDPARGWSPWSPQKGWDHKLLLLGGPNCGISFAEGAAPNPLMYMALTRGFAVASNALDATGNDCNLVTQAESEMMTKERVIDEYGLVRYTMGIGGSGESVVQQAVANAYPGIYDGIIPESSFPDAWVSAVNIADDCVQLVHYWSNPGAWQPGVTWTPADMSAVEDGEVPSSCAVYQAAFEGLFTPAGSNSGVSSGQLYNATGNPCGVRTTLWDYSVNVLGRRPRSAWTQGEQKCGRGFANRPLDNVGVEYGLNALLAGQITPAQFTDLNATIGGRDIDYNAIPQRTAADLAGLAAAYRSGEIDEANNIHIPMIDVRTQAEEELHDTFESYEMRARLDAAHGNHDNQVIWLTTAYNTGFEPDPVMQEQAFAEMNTWLDAVEADPSGASFAQKVVSDKPASAVDRCTTAGGVAIPCAVLPSGQARLGAGEPITNDIWACQRKPLTPADFAGPTPVAFTPAELAELQKAFPTGVCDWSKPGIDQQPTVPWQTYQNAQGQAIYGGTPLGPPPVSIPFGPTTPTGKGCTSLRAFRIRLGPPNGLLKDAVVRVDGRRIRVIARKGKRPTAVIDLRGLRRGKVTVTITGRTRAGRFRDVRVYHPCPAKSVHGVHRTPKQRKA